MVLAVEFGEEVVYEAEDVMVSEMEEEMSG